MTVKFTKEQLSMDRYRESYDNLCALRQRTIDQLYAAQGILPKYNARKVSK
jgi:hypothetical protein